MTEVVQQEKLSAQDCVQAGDRSFRQEQWEEAVASYRQALVLQPELVPAFCKLGKALLRQKHWDEAQAQFERAIALNPQSHLASYGLAEVAMGQQHWTVAADRLRRVVAMGPGFLHKACLDLGQVLQQLEQWEEAISIYCVALRHGEADESYEGLAAALCKRAASGQ